MAALLSRGITVIGTVTRAEHGRKSRAVRVSELRYKFRAADGTEIERRIKVLPRDIETFSVGQSLEIVYDPSDPNVNMLKEQVDSTRRTMANADRKT
jgi:hypothetical protein